jgi:hypothetical protein
MTGPQPCAAEPPSAGLGPCRSTCYAFVSLQSVQRHDTGLSLETTTAALAFEAFAGGAACNRQCVPLAMFTGGAPCWHQAACAVG